MTATDPKNPSAPRSAVHPILLYLPRAPSANLSDVWHWDCSSFYSRIAGGYCVLSATLGLLCLCLFVFGTFGLDTDSRLLGKRGGGVSGMQLLVRSMINAGEEV